MVLASLSRRWCLLSLSPSGPSSLGYRKPCSSCRFQSSNAPKPKSSPTPTNTTIHLEHENDNTFTGASGFWPQTPDPVEPEDAVDPPDKIDSVSIFDDPVIPSHLRPRTHTRKLDLSYFNTFAERRLQAPSDRLTSFAPISTGFRANKGVRAVFATYVTQLKRFFHLLDYPSTEKPSPNIFFDLSTEYIEQVGPSVLDNASTEHSEKATASELDHLLAEPDLIFLRKKSYEPMDLVTWAWILHSETVSQSVKRFVTVADKFSHQRKPALPRFVVLQLLRAPSIDAVSFQALLASLSRSVQDHPLHMIEEDGSTIIDIEPDQAPARAKDWDYGSARILAVRLLRHARLVYPEKLDDVINLACTMQFSLRDEKARGFDSLTMFCNRLLTLVSLPSSVKPHRSLRHHQKAHLSLLRRMFAQKPQIHLNREGYRALIKLQLLHEKIEQEKTWARAKSESWPPWQKPRMGIDDKLEKSGMESRAMKMLRRMTEAGYMHGLWEKAASVLAGWDTDRSPTIQTRQILAMPPSAALHMSPIHAVSTLFGSDIKTPPTMAAQLWAARVSATRSLREAWACFTEYRKSVDRDSKRLEPYHAMFEKMLAKTQETETDDDVLPGDSPEVWRDPISTRSLVYLETNVPSRIEFYKIMLSDGVRPAGRLLSLLVDHAQSIDEGISYLKDSSYSEMKKDVLLHSYKYSSSTVRDSIASIPNHFFAAFLALLFRPHGTTSLSDFQFQQVSSASKDEQIEPVDASRYGVALLANSETIYPPAYHAIFDGLVAQMSVRGYVSSRNKHHDMAWLALTRMNKKADIQLDFKTFHKFGSFVQKLSKGESNSSRPRKYLKMTKQLFAAVVYGSRAIPWLPTAMEDPIITVPDPEHIRMLVEILGLWRDIDGLVELVEWMAQHADKLRTNQLEMTSGERAMRRALFTLRVFLEGVWADDNDWALGISVATEEQISRAQEKLLPLGWPSAEEMAGLVEENYTWLQWVRKAIWESRKSEQRGSEESSNEKVADQVETDQS